ncbi:MAG: hypothetical protein LBO00_02665 [Zoogloeaceae bacterium]|jgi:hypothetical protein|nr:hypothetical protein [Zoogloeaceae bacterium]
MDDLLRVFLGVITTICMIVMLLWRDGIRKKKERDEETERLFATWDMQEILKELEECLKECDAAAIKHIRKRGGHVPPRPAPPPSKGGQDD